MCQCYSYLKPNSNKQKDKDSSKKELLYKGQNFAGNAQNHSGENKNFRGKTKNSVIENNKSTDETPEWKYTHEDREREKPGISYCSFAIFASSNALSIKNSSLLNILENTPCSAQKIFSEYSYSYNNLNICNIS